MTFLEPGADPRTKHLVQAREPIAPWAVRRATVLGLPVVALAVAGSAAWFWLSARLFMWFVPAACAGVAVATIVWSAKIIRKRELRAIEIWQAVAESMPDADKHRYARRLDKFIVGQRGGVVVVVSPPPPVDQPELDRIGHRAATARMLRAEPVQIVKNPRRLRGGYSVRFGFVPK